MTTDLERENGLLRILVTYLLFERKQETVLQLAFSLLAQERHNHFHTKGDKKNGDGTDFSECMNPKCEGAFDVLKNSREMAVELNDIAVNFIKDTKLHVEKKDFGCRAWIEFTPPQEEEKTGEGK